MVARRYRTEICLHFVWATHLRLPLVTPDIEQGVYACILNQVKELGCTALAIGGIPDHLHLAVTMAPTIAPSAFMQRVKGVSSAFVRDQLVTPGDTFAWQHGYGAFSFSRSHRERVIEYITNQKRHHAEGNLWTAWEQIEE